MATTKALDGRQLRRGETRARLINSAKSVMAESSLDGATIDEIIQGANVGRGSFYNHFSSKEDLYVATFDAIISEIGDSFDIGRLQIKDAAEFAAWSIRILVKRATDDPEIGWFIVNSAESQRVLEEQIDSRVRAVIEDGVREGRFKLTSPELWFTIGAASTTAFIRGCLEGRFDVSQSAELAAAMLELAGLSRAEAKDIADRCRPE
ncbi:MAG: TetR/AcrR family transcriptional regulator [Pseudomonadota bacterium]